MIGRALNLVSFLTIFFISVFLTIPAFAGNGKPVSFGVTAPKTKVGDGFLYATRSWISTYGPGNSIIVNGNEVYAAITADNVHYAFPGEVEVRFCSSLNRGSSWGRCTAIATGQYDGYGASIAIGPDPLNPGQRLLHVVWGDMSGGIYYVRGTYAGTTMNSSVWNWSAPVLINGTVFAEPYTRSIAADGQGGVHIAYSGFRSDVGPGVYYSKSSDSGISFEETGTLVATPAGTEPTIAADAAGNVFVAWQGLGFSKRLAGSSSFTAPIIIDGGLGASWCSMAVYDMNTICASSENNTSVYISCTRNGGNTRFDWTQNIVASGAGDRTNLVFGPGGVLNMIWLGKDGSTWSIYFSRSSNFGSSWTPPVPVAESPGDYYDAKVAIDDLGKVYILYPEDDSEIVYFTKEK